MTEELFREDATLAECDAVVTAVDERGVQLDRTVFYPHGGGQAGDRGELVLADGRVDRDRGHAQGRAAGRHRARARQRGRPRGVRGRRAGARAHRRRAAPRAHALPVYLNPTNN